MCGRYALLATGELQTRFEITGEVPELDARYNVAPTQTLPVIVRNSPNRVALMRWGLIPSWAKDASGAGRMINARAETVAEKPSYRTALRSRRCLVPANGFFEWRRVGATRTPFYIHMKDESLFAFAGLYDTWRDPNGVAVTTYTIITTEPNELVATIHDRMPVILHREDEDRWLDPGITDPGAVLPLLHPHPAEGMATYPISTTVNSPAHDSPDILQPANG